MEVERRRRHVIPLMYPQKNLRTHDDVEEKVGTELNNHIFKYIYITYYEAGTQVHVVNLTIHTNPRTTTTKVSAAILTLPSCIYRNDPLNLVKQ